MAKFDTPSKALKSEQVIGSKPLGALAPTTADVPAEFVDRSTETAQRWDRFFLDWQSNGLNADDLHPRSGIDAMTVLWHLCAVQNQADVPAEDRRAACAWLASKWLE